MKRAKWWYKDNYNDSESWIGPTGKEMKAKWTIKGDEARLVCREYSRMMPIATITIMGGVYHATMGCTEANKSFEGWSDAKSWIALKLAIQFAPARRQTKRVVKSSGDPRLAYARREYGSAEKAWEDGDEFSWMLLRRDE